MEEDDYLEDDVLMGSDALSKAQFLFRCNKRQLHKFTAREDPFNEPNTLSGIICKKDGPFGGSMLITHVNGKLLSKEQVIYGTPKLAYPYTKEGYDTNTYKDFDKALDNKCSNFLLANKWNGTNLMVFKYKDKDGKIFVTAKTKGSTTVTNQAFGSFFSLTCKALNCDNENTKIINFKNLPEQLEELKDPDIQSKCFELCGRQEPHLVKYDFDIELKPLFLTYMDGSIAPCRHDDDEGPFDFNGKKLVTICEKSQENDYKANENYRKTNNLSLRYEHDHFITEGKVLYLMDDKGKLLKRTMYKIKPKDIEEVHWGRFTETMQGRVREAVEKVVLRGKEFSEKSIREELDMRQKEWGKFGREVMRYARELKEKGIVNDKRQIIIVVGNHDNQMDKDKGSLREKFMLEMSKRGFEIVDGEINEMMKTIHKKMTRSAGRLIIDKHTDTLGDRKEWIDAAVDEGVKKITCAYICKKGQKGPEKPHMREGFTNVYMIEEESELKKMSQRIASL